MLLVDSGHFLQAFMYSSSHSLYFGSWFWFSLNLLIEMNNLVFIIFYSSELLFVLVLPYSAILCVPVNIFTCVALAGDQGHSTDSTKDRALSRLITFVSRFKQTHIVFGLFLSCLVYVLEVKPWLLTNIFHHCLVDKIKKMNY